MSKYIILFSLAFGLAACKQDPVTPQGTQFPLTASGTGDAHPALTFVSRTTDVNHRPTIAVSDSDGTDYADVATCHSGYFATAPTWSASGASVSYAETDASNPWHGSSLRAVDVEVSNGRAHGINARAILNLSQTDSMYIRGQAWSPSSSNNEIAFIAHTPTEEAIYLISASGGTPTKIYSINNLVGHIALTAPTAQYYGLAVDNASTVTWSGDGSKLAFVLVTMPTATSDSVTAIKVIDRSGSLINTPASYVGAALIESPQWSHAGLDKIAFYSSSVGFMLVGALDGSTPQWLVDLSSGYPTHIHWSPDNSEFIFSILGSWLYDQGTWKMYSSGNFIGEPLYDAITPGDWKQP
jgi:Tol biopolymer transport system component